MEEQINQNQPNPEEAPKMDNQPNLGEKPAAGAPDKKDVEENKLWAFVGYLGILCLIPLLAKKDSPFAQFHAKQGLILTIAGFFAWVPVVGWILGIAAFIFWIMGIISVFSGNMKPLPIVGELAKKINI
jgi:uncharacterized membrane protein